MRLFELTGYKNSPLYKAASALKSQPDGDTNYDSNSMKDVNAELHKGGWRLVGKGHYSNVFENPKYPYVLKVFVDENYKNWLNAVLKYQDNPYLPKIRGKFIKLNKEATAARIEKLQPLSGDMDPIFAQYVPDEVEPSLENFLYDDGAYYYQQKNFPELGQAFKLALKTRAPGRELDLNKSNFMKRGNTLVLTDPLG